MGPLQRYSLKYKMDLNRTQESLCMIRRVWTGNSSKIKKLRDCLKVFLKNYFLFLKYYFLKQLLKTVCIIYFDLFL